MERVFWSFPGPLFQFERRASWALAAQERVRSKFIELTTRIGHCYESQGAVTKACTFYLRALDLYPTSERCYEALIRGRLAQGELTSAVEDYRRYERMLATAIHTRPSSTIRALITPLLTPTSATPSAPNSLARKLA